MDYQNPYEKSAEEIELLNGLVDEILLRTADADKYYEQAIDLRIGAQTRLCDSCDLSDSELLSTLCLWYGSGYVIQILGQWGICKHEMRRIDCALCSRNVQIERNQ